jgi:hypothetical protein
MRHFDFRLLRDFGPFLLGVGAWAWRKWRGRGNALWPTAQATVWSYRFDSNVPIVLYNFYVNGQYYSGEFKAAERTSFLWFGKNQPVEQRYPLGSAFPIRYKPDDPSFSVPTSLPAASLSL